MTETALREEICRLGRSLFERGLTPGSSGNISVRLDDGGWLVTPTNASLGSLDPARLSRLAADGRLVSGDAPTKEVPLHTALYQTRSASRAVVHLHSTHSVALSMLPEIDPRAALPPMTAYYLMKCGATALVPYYRPGDPAVADAIKGLAGKYSSVLLANHGPVVAGEYAGSRRLCDRGTGRDRKTLSAVARAEPALSHAGADRRFVEDLRADIAGARRQLTTSIHRRHSGAMRSIEPGMTEAPVSLSTVYSTAICVFRRSVTSINPGACVIANGSLAAAITACGVTPQAQNTGISSASTGTGSP